MTPSSIRPSVRIKRKAIDDFFTPTSKRIVQNEGIVAIQRQPQQQEAADRSSAADFVPGLALHDNFITLAEEQQILGFLEDASKCTWRTDLSRRTMHFGGTYCLMPSKTESTATQARPKIIQAPSMPKELTWLVERMVVANIFQQDKKPQYCIVNEYTGNLGISAHTENFQFGEPVVGLSLLSSCPIRFHELEQPFDGSVRSGKAGRAEKTGRRADIQLPGRSLMVMNGDSRWKWQHEIVRTAKGRGLRWKRVSLTFRWKDQA